MTNFIGKKVLVTTQSWFFGKNGQSYRACWGTLKAIHEAGKTLGFIPNRAHANWFIEVGDMIIMGCQVLYVQVCDEKPNTDMVKDYQTEGGVLKEFERPSNILILD